MAAMDTFELHMRREEKPTRCHWMLYCTYAQHVSGTSMPIIWSSRLYMLLAPMVCSAWLLVFGCQVQGSRLCVQEKGCWTSSFELQLTRFMKWNFARNWSEVAVVLYGSMRNRNREANFSSAVLVFLLVARSFRMFITVGRGRGVKC